MAGQSHITEIQEKISGKVLVMQDKEKTEEAEDLERFLLPNPSSEYCICRVKKTISWWKYYDHRGICKFTQWQLKQMRQEEFPYSAKEIIVSLDREVQNLHNGHRYFVITSRGLVIFAQPVVVFNVRKRDVHRHGADEDSAFIIPLPETMLNRLDSDKSLVIVSVRVDGERMLFYPARISDGFPQIERFYDMIEEDGNMYISCSSKNKYYEKETSNTRSILDI